VKGYAELKRFRNTIRPVAEDRRRIGRARVDGGRVEQRQSASKCAGVISARSACAFTGVPL
jgi:hypothetical protein